MKNYTKIIFAISSLLLVTGCAVNQGLFKTKNGSYLLENKKSSAKRAPVVYGYLYEEGNNTPLIASGVKLDSKARFSSDPVSGKYKITLKPGSYRFTGQGYGYNWVKTKSLKLSVGDSLKLDFSLKPDTTPLYNRNL